MEQNARMAMQSSHYSYVLENGLIRLEGESGELRSDDFVRRLYLGG